MRHLIIYIVVCRDFVGFIVNCCIRLRIYPKVTKIFCWLRWVVSPNNIFHNVIWYNDILEFKCSHNLICNVWQIPYFNWTQDKFPQYFQITKHPLNILPCTLLPLCILLFNWCMQFNALNKSGEIHVDAVHENKHFVEFFIFNFEWNYSRSALTLLKWSIQKTLLKRGQVEYCFIIECSSVTIQWSQKNVIVGNSLENMRESFLVPETNLIMLLGNFPFCMRTIQQSQHPIHTVYIAVQLLNVVLSWKYLLMFCWLNHQQDRHFTTCWWHVSDMLVTCWWHVGDMLVACWWHVGEFLTNIAKNMSIQVLKRHKNIDFLTHFVLEPWCKGKSTTHAKGEIGPHGHQKFEKNWSICINTSFFIKIPILLPVSSMISVSDPVIIFRLGQGGWCNFA